MRPFGFAQGKPFDFVRGKRHMFLLAVVLGIGTVAEIGAQQGRTARDLALPTRVSYGSTGVIEVLPVQGNIYMLAGAGSNVTVQVGPEALFVVDTNEAAMSDRMLAAIGTISKLPMRFIVNTSADPDHVGGNERFAKSSGANVNAFFGQGARVYATENTFTRLANPKDGTAPLPTALWPTDVFTAPLKSLFVTGEPIELIHIPSAHSDGDVIVFFRKSDVIAAGDIFLTGGYPVIDDRRGGSLDGVLAGLNRLIDLAVPEFNSMGGTRIIPGHGRISNEIDLVEYRDALTIIADRVTQLVLEGRTVEQVNAAGVSLDYDGIYGATSGPWTTDMFIEAVYREAKANTAAWRSRLLRNVPIDQLPQLTTGIARPSGRPAASAAATTRTARRASLDPLEGTWVFDEFASKYEPAVLMPYRREMTFSFTGDELRLAVSTWRRQGNNSPLTTVTYEAKLDGRPYPVPPATATVAFRRINANTIERVLTGDRNSKEVSTWTLSADRRTLTVVAAGTDTTGMSYSSTQVYNKQQ